MRPLEPPVYRVSAHRLKVGSITSENLSSAADYARNRADGHFQRVAELLHSAGHEPGQSQIPTRDTRLPFLDSRTWRPTSHGIGVP